MAIPANLIAPTNPPLASVAPVDNRYLAVADYAHLYCFDASNASIQSVGRPQNLQGVWQPTGVAYNATLGRAYVANYAGNNIVELQLDCSTASAVVSNTISSASTVSPENVALTDDGSMLASANYDGSTVTVFKNVNGVWNPAWTASVGNAHGVAIIGNTLYATSLHDRTITAFDLKSGSPLKTVGSLGADGTKNQYMWPTGLANFNGTLLVTDAHTGYVCALDATTLATETCFGGLGGGIKLFNMPYGVAVRGNQVLVADAFSSQLLNISFDLAQRRAIVTNNWYWTGSRPVNPDYVAYQGSPRAVAIATNPYSSVCQMPPWLSSFTCAYAGLTSNSQFLRFMTEASILPAPGEFYFIQSFPGHNSQDVYFFSPQSIAVINARVVNGVPYILSRNYGAFGLFDDGTALVSPSTSIQKTSIETTFDGLVSSLDAARTTSGVILPQDAAPLLLSASSTGADLASALQASVGATGSASGQAFLNAYLSCTANSCDANLVKQSAIDFFSEQSKDNDVLLDRELIPCMLANAKCVPAI
jgi:DNA-binding beta-propeller fold protein YncE